MENHAIYLDAVQSPTVLGLTLWAEWFIHRKPHSGHVDRLIEVPLTTGSHPRFERKKRMPITQNWIQF